LTITHPHIDHVRGVGLLLDPSSPFKVANIITNGLEISSAPHRFSPLVVMSQCGNLQQESNGLIFSYT